MHDEGVIKFEADHSTTPLPDRDFGELVCKLAAWREILAKMGVIGQSPELYGGAGYGNVSGRVGAPSAPLGRRPFLVTGTQTGGEPCLGPDHFCLVRSYDPKANRVTSRGPTRPSSESLTHGALYDLGSHIRFVFHGHTPIVWRNAAALGLPTTDPTVPYGTPGMAREVQRLYREGRLPETRVLAMGGHEDGVVVFGRSPDEAGQALLAVIARAYELHCRRSGAICSTLR